MSSGPRNASFQEDLFPESVQLPNADYHAGRSPTKFSHKP